MENLFVGNKIIQLHSIDSTNNYAAKLLLQPNVAEGTVIMADFQTNGRGQRGNEWHSESGVNLMCSIILNPTFLPIEHQFGLSKVAALAIYDVLVAMGVKNVRVKWPNDVLVNNKKIAGVLIENAVQGVIIKNAVMGIGINVNQTDFTAYRNATSVALQLGRKLSVAEVSKRLFNCVERRYLQLKNDIQSLDDEYLKHLYGSDQPIKFSANGNQFSSRILGVANDGKLMLNYNEELKQFALNEVKVLI